MLNKVILQGRLTDEPDLRTTQSGTSVVPFTVATNDDYNKETTYFINCVAWRQTGEFISKYFHKGSLILCEGKLSTRPYEDKNGNKRVATEVVVDKVWFGESKKQSDAPQTPVMVELDDSDGDLPF